MRRGAHDERGIVLPSPVAALSLGAVVLAGVAFLTTSGGSDDPAQAARVTTSPAPTVTSTTPAAKPEVEKKADEKARQKPKPKKPKVDRAQVYVEVYNNSGISGLAGSTAKKLSGAGWQVVGSDNWYGTIPASTVYYPARLQPAAKLLARDIGISRLKPAISPMRFDRLTVILTGDAR